MRLKSSTDKFINDAKADLASQKIDKKENLKRLVVDLPEHLHKELKMMSIKEDKKMRELIAEMIEERIRSYR